MINEVAQKWLEIKIFTQISGLKKNKKNWFPLHKGQALFRMNVKTCFRKIY